jgi:general nucleoside transport system permease protein
MTIARKFPYRIERRKDVGLAVDLLSILIALAASIGVAAVIIASSGANPAMLLLAILKGSFGSKNAFIDTLLKSTPILITGLATVIAFRAKVWNIGQEGQLYAGAIGATFIVLTFPGLNLPSFLYIPLLLVAAVIGGAIWGGIPGYLKAKFKVNEIVVTVMFNYIMLYLTAFLLGGAWQEPKSHYYNTIRFPASTELPMLFGTRLHSGFALALLIAVGVYFLLWKMKLGYEIRAMGINPTASKYKGIPIQTTSFVVMLISGAICGLGGGIEILGVQHRLLYGFSANFGFTGILIALLGRLNPFGVVIAAIFFGALQNGSAAMIIYSNVPRQLVTMIMGLVIIMLLFFEALFKYRVRRVYHAE